MPILRTPNGKLLRTGGKLLKVTAGSAQQPTQPPTQAPDPADNGTGKATPVSMPNDRIYQRVGTSKVITVAATVTGGDGLVEARMVSKSGSGLTAWTSIGTSSGGTATGQLEIPQGGWYYLQTRKASNPGAVTTDTARFCVGILQIMFGQSNMKHLFEAVIDYPLSDYLTRRFNGTAWVNVGNCDTTGTLAPGAKAFGTGGWAGNANVKGTDPSGDGITTFVNHLRAGLNVPIGTLEFAQSGSGIDTWVPGGSNWATLLAAIQAAGGDVESAIWYQGEDNTGMPGATYKAKLLSILDALKAQTGRNAATFKFGVVLLGPAQNYGVANAWGPMRATQLSFIDENPGVYLAGSAADMVVPSWDAVHITNPSQVRMGRRYAKSAIAALAGTTKSWPKITGATRTGNVVTVSIGGATGALKDDLGGTGANLKGFRGFNNGTPVAINSTLISGATVQITFAGPVTTIDYAMADLPYGDFSPPAGAVLHDSDTVLGETVGLPLLPCSAITVTGS